MFGEISSKITTTPIHYNGKTVSGKTITVTSLLNIDRRTAWQELQKGELLRYVSYGKNSFTNLPETWDIGEEVHTSVKTFAGSMIPLFGKIPHIQNTIPVITPHSITFTDINHEDFSASTKESNPTIKVWDHNMMMESENEGESTRYTDKVTIYAGLLTGILGKNTEALYRHRHERWQQVIEILKNGESTSDIKHRISPLEI